MTWETPWFTEIDMSAEIGGYQGEFGPEPTPDPAFGEPGAASARAEHDTEHG